LEDLGEATAREQSAVVPALREKVCVNIGKKYESNVGMSSRILLVLALEGKIVRARPLGSWVSSQYRWASTTRRFGRAVADGTEMDLRWWTGWTARAIRSALATIEALEVDLDGQVGYVLPDDIEPVPDPGPWVALLPSLDPTTMGWKQRDWYLANHQRLLFDSSGNAGPTIWANGRIVGGWAARKNGEVVTRILEDVGEEIRSMIESEA